MNAPQGGALPPAIRTTCPYCGVGCGVLAVPDPGGAAAIRGDVAHPANHGRLCSKGSALAETLSLEDRLLYPELDGGRVSWDQALEGVAEGFQRVIREHGPDAVGFYVSGQLLTEDYYCANKLMKGFIGTANIDTNSRLCMSSSVAGHKRAFGADAVPCSYEDVDKADLLVFVGSNAAWCHPVLFQRALAARRRRPEVRIVVIDPRRTATAEEANLHLAIAPGTDAVLFNGLLNHLRREDALDWRFLERHTEGFAAALEAARDGTASIPQIAARCGLEEADLARFFRWFTGTGKVVTLYSQGINQSSSGTDKVNAIINCHLAGGRIGRPGMGPFSLTGQPNAMGGREVGGLANQLAAHMDLDNPEHRDRVARFWGTARIPRAPGLTAVELFEAVEQGRVRAVWIMATNPVVTLPDADRVRRALGRCELVVVSDCVRNTDTAAVADILLPALAWGEKDGTVTNSERRISRQRRFLPPPGEARADWWIITQVALRMGFADAFPYQSAAEVFREHAGLTAFENGGSRVLDLGALAAISDQEYEDLDPVQWPLPAHRPGGSARLFGDGRYYNPGGKARLIPVRPRAPAHASGGDYPLVLNTGRLRDHWHTLTRTGRSPRLSAHAVEPMAEVHPQDAARLGLSPGALVRIHSRWGQAMARVRISEAQQPGCVFVPMHWNDAFARLARINAVVNPDTDPVSRQPELKHTPVRLEPVDVAWEALLLTRQDRLPKCGDAIWVRSRAEACQRLSLAGTAAAPHWRRWLARMVNQDTGEWMELADPGAGRYRAAVLARGRLQHCLFVAPARQTLPDGAWLAELFQRSRLSAEERRFLLCGRPPAGCGSGGPRVCACFNVGRDTILAAIRAGAASVEAVGEALQAGTNCGSCRPEIKALLAGSGAMSPAS